MNTSITWDRADWESSAIDMDTDEEAGSVWHGECGWAAEANGATLAEEFRSQRAAEIAVELALEWEDMVN